jgi:hypothetical protein
MKTYKVIRYLSDGAKVVWKHVKATSAQQARSVAGQAMVGGLVIVTREKN